MYVSILEKFVVLGVEMLPRLDGRVTHRQSMPAKVYQFVISEATCPAKLLHSTSACMHACTPGGCSKTRACPFADAAAAVSGGVQGLLQLHAGNAGCFQLPMQCGGPVTPTCSCTSTDAPPPPPTSTSADCLQLPCPSSQQHLLMATCLILLVNARHSPTVAAGCILQVLLIQGLPTLLLSLRASTARKHWSLCVSTCWV